MTLQLPQIEEPKTLTHSSKQCFKTCNRKYFLQYEMLLRPAHDSDALRIGSAFHVGVEAAKGGATAIEAEATVRGMYADQQCTPWLSAEEFQIQEEIAVALVAGWCRKWSGDLIVDYIAVERVFDLPISNPTTGRTTPTFRGGGKIDGICVLPDGRLAVIEHKTCGEELSIESDYWKRLQIDSQISQYVVAARQLGHDVVTTIYDVVRKPSIRPKNVAKADRALATANGNYFGVKLTEMCPERETPKMFAGRLLADMKDRPDFYFARMEIPRMASDLEEFNQEQWTLQKQIRDCELNQREWGAAAWPRNTGACSNPYPCQFLSICKGVNGDPTQEIPNGFKRATTAHEELAI